MMASKTKIFIIVAFQIISFETTRAEETLPQWVTDGTPGFTVSGNVVSSAQTGHYGSPANALWKESPEGIKSGTHYWEIKIIEGNEYFIGLSDLQKFQKGWTLDGLFYGGNLADGSALLVSNFGPWPKAGDTVGMLVKFEDGKMKIYFYFNDRSLGIGYDLDENVLDGGYPTVQFHGPGSVSIEKISYIPPTTEREPERFESPLEGDWELVSFKKDGSEEKIPKSVPLRITLNQGEETNFWGNMIEKGGSTVYSVMARVINSIWATWVFNEEDGSWMSYPGATTLVGGPVELMKYEMAISTLISSVKDVKQANRELIINSESNGVSMESVWKRYTPLIPIVTKNPFDRT